MPRGARLEAFWKILAIGGIAQQEAVKLKQSITLASMSSGETTGPLFNETIRNFRPLLAVLNGSKMWILRRVSQKLNIFSDE
jgi:hypothetical protein